MNIRATSGIGGPTNKNDQKVESVKYHSYTEILDELWLSTSLNWRTRVDLIKTSKMINGILNYGRHFFSIFPLELVIYGQISFQKLSIK